MKMKTENICRHISYLFETYIKIVILIIWNEHESKLIKTCNNVKNLSLKRLTFKNCREIYFVVNINTLNKEFIIFVLELILKRNQFVVCTFFLKSNHWYRYLISHSRCFLAKIFIYTFIFSTLAKFFWIWV